MIEWKDVVVKAPLSQAPFSLKVPAGVTMFLGEGYARGTLLVRAAAGAAWLKGGTVELSGEAPKKALSKIGYAQASAAYPLGTRVDELFALVETARGLARGTLAKNLAQAGLADTLTLDLGTLPSGAQKAVALVTALEAQFVLLEEPFADLDPRAHAFVRAEIESARGGKRTIVFSSASFREARLADRIFIIAPDGARAVEANDARFFSIGGDYRLEIASTDARKVAALLASDASVSNVALLSHERLIVTTHEPQRLLRAVQSGVARGDFSLSATEWRSAAP